MHGRCKYEYKTITQLWRIDFLFSVVWRPPSVNFTFDKQTPRWIASSELQFFLSSSLKSSTLFQEIEPVSFYSHWIFFGINFLSYLLNSRFKLHPCQPLQRSKQSGKDNWKFLFSEQFERNIMASKSLFPYSFPTRDLEDFWKIDYHKCSKIYPYLVNNCHCWNVLPETKFKY